MNVMNKVVFRGMLQKTNQYDRILTKRRRSSRDKYIKNDLEKDVKRTSNLDTKLRGKGIKKLSYHSLKLISTPDSWT